MLTIAICAMLIVGAGLFAVAVLRFAWYAALCAWRAVLHVAAGVVHWIATRKTF